MIDPTLCPEGHPVEGEGFIKWCEECQTHWREDVCKEKQEDMFDEE